MRSIRLAAIGLLFMGLGPGCASAQKVESAIPPLALPNSPDTVRVRLLTTKVPTRLAATGPFQYQLKKGGKVYPCKTSVRVRATHRTLIFDRRSFAGDVTVIPVNAADVLKINGRRYRGAMVFHPSGNGRYEVIEYVGVQEYLYGVLPREVSPDWPLDALKAQAIVSRTYAMSTKLQDTNGRYDLSDSIYDQVYGGFEVEHPASNRAVDLTKGEALLNSEGRPLQAFFHSSCGGHTELPQHVWHTSAPNEVYGQVSDVFCQGDPHYVWTLERSFSTIRTNLRKAGIRLRDLKKITVVQKSGSGRAEIIGLVTSRGTVEVPGNRFRLALGADALRSTLFTSLQQTKRAVHFEGRGWGHGVGLCQWGAHGRAMAGQRYEKILETYFPGARLKRLDSLSS